MKFLTVVHVNSRGKEIYWEQFSPLISTMERSGCTIRTVLTPIIMDGGKAYIPTESQEVEIPVFDWRAQTWCWITADELWV